MYPPYWLSSKEGTYQQYGKVKGLLLMREYYVDDFKNKKEYKKFIEYMLENSDFFHLFTLKRKKMRL